MLRQGRALTLAVVSIALLLTCLTALQDPGLLPARVRDLFHEELSGELAKEHVLAITRHHRVQASRGYRRAAEYVLDQLRAAGFGPEEAWIESFPSDGRRRYQTWQSPSGWDIASAELRMLEPREERLVGYPEIAMSVVTYSNPGEVTAELVWVGPGTREEDYAGKEVRGKFVLATGYGGAVHRKAVLEHGAAAVVCYLDDARATDHPDMLAYTGMWPRPEELEDTTFGFNLTNRQGEGLRRLLEAGRRVVLHGRVVGTGLEPFFLDVVVARIPGRERPEEEILLCAHLDHPKESANDNASGSAAILDLARSLRSLVDSGRLPRPRRSLRFLWVPEWNGTMAWVDAHPEAVGPRLGGGVLANLDLDMVGEDLEQLHSALVLTRPLDSTPSALGDLVAEMARMVDGLDVRTPRGGRSRFNWRATPYSGGSDHMMFLDRGVPAVMFSHSPDYTHHTSEDTPDKVDPVELERCELIAAATAWVLADTTPEQALELAGLVEARAAGRLGDAARRARRLAAAGQAFEAWNLLQHAREREVAAMAELLGYQGAPAVRAAVAGARARLEAQAAALLAELFPEAPARPWPDDPRVPERRTRGPLAFDLPERLLAGERLAWYRSPGFPLSGDLRFELVNLVDGRRSVAAIRDFLAAEFAPLPQAAVARYLEDLVAVGVLAWKGE